MRFLLALLAAATLGAAEPPRPNVVLIMADDFGYECVGAHGGTSYQTPHLDRLAAGGMRFDYAYAQPLCTPTRVQLMTGQSNYRNYTHFGHLDPAQTTFAHLFRKAGYATCVVGKWQLGGGFEGPGRFGFDEYCLWQLTRRPSRYPNAGLEINGKEVNHSGGEYGPQIVNDYALDFISRHKEKPFLLYYPMILTHDPFVPTPDNPEYDRTAVNEGQGKDVKYFADMTAFMDKMVGNIVARLEREGLREKTLILFTGDNGTGAGIPSRMGDRVVNGGKGSSRDRGIHVPLIVSWPGAIKAGGVSTDLVDSTDYLPTICAAAGIEVPADLPLDGQSFLPQLLGKPAHPRQWNYCWYARGGGARADHEFAYNQKFKLYRDGRFYHWAVDSEEQNPLPPDAEPEVRKLLQSALDRYAAPRPAGMVAQAEATERKGKKKRRN